MAEEKPFNAWKYARFTIPLSPEQMAAVKALRIQDPWKPEDVRNENLRARFWWLPPFVSRRLWPVRYEWLTPGELMVKRRLQVHEVMNRSMFGGGQGG